jgi:hypothetical protein
MISKKLIFTIYFSLLIQSCSFNNLSDSLKKTDCAQSDQEIKKRQNLFPPISNSELKRRHAIKLPSLSNLEDESVVSKIVKAIKSSPKNSKYIAVDLRGYKDVDLTNIMFSNESDFTLTPYLYSSKYSQGFFSLININESSITIAPPEVFKAFKPQKIYRPDLIDSEIVINSSDAETIFGNMKFSKDIKFSLIADNIKKPYRLDLREASNMQFNLNRKWIMPVYSLENSTIEHSKITTAFIQFINNKNSQISLKKFYKSIDKCYIEEGKSKFSN